MKKFYVQHKFFCCTFLKGEELELVSNFKYLGVVLDSNLTFKKHIKKVKSTINFNLKNFRQIRPYLSIDAAKTYLHCMILSHIDYCLTNWSFAGVTVIKPIEQLYKKAIKVFDKKPNTYHHCNILEKYHLLSFENFKNFKNACLVFKCLHGLAPPPLMEFIHRRRNTGHETRSMARGDCEVYGRRTAFGQNVLSIKGCQYWNELPAFLREIPTFPAFKGQLKQWLKDNQSCEHNLSF